MYKHYCSFCFAFFSFCILFAQDKISIVDAYIQDYDFRKALQYIETQQSTKELLFKKALCYKGLEDNQKAISVLLELEHLYKDDVSILRELATGYKSLSNWAKALACYERLIKLVPNNTYYQIQKADMFFQAMQYKNALIAYDTLLNTHGLDNLLKRKAMCFEQMNRLDSAALYYERAWRRDSIDSFAAVNLVNTLLKIQTKDKILDAMSFSDRFIRKDTTNKQMNLLNALSYYVAGTDYYEDAIYRLERCYENGDSSIILQRSLGMAYYTLDYNMKAKPFLQRVHEIDSLNNNVLFCLANVSNSLKEYDKAAEYFDKLLARAIPSKASLYFYYKGLATGLEGLQKYNESIETYKQALENASNSQKMYLYFTIGAIYDYDLLQPAEALEYYLLYKTSLLEFRDRVGKEGEVTPNEIKELNSKIGSLQERIDRLQKPKTKAKKF